MEDLQLIDIEKLMYENNLTQKDVAKYLGVRQSSISAVKRGVIQMPKRWVKKLNESDWVIKSSEEGTRAIPIYDGEVYGSFVTSLDQHIQMRPEAFINIPIFSEGDLAVQVRGNSMKGLINNGDHVVIKKLTSHRSIMYGEPHLIVMNYDNIQTVKFIKKHPEGNKLYLVPYNIEQFDAQEVMKEDISEVWRVIGRFNGF